MSKKPPRKLPLGNSKCMWKSNTKMDVNKADFKDGSLMKYRMTVCTGLLHYYCVDTSGSITLSVL
jgi:hypothetical protein